MTTPLRTRILLADDHELVRTGLRMVLDLEPDLKVVAQAADGPAAVEIAETLTISIKTVERHRANVLEKLGLRDRVALTRYAIRSGLTEA